MITPFKLFIKNNFPFIENTYEALDNYGLLCKIVEKLNEVVDSENQLNLKLDNFIDTLDVQAAVNEKLDEMAEDGTLAEIINSQLFNSLNERVTANEENITTLQTNLGNIANLNTDTKQNIVAAINEVYFKLNYYIGNLQNLHTETKLDVVSAINEVYDYQPTLLEYIGENTTKIGNLENLTTENKNNLVSAINEIESKNNKYSTTEETIIGTYNGLPLYRKMYRGQAAVITSAGTIINISNDTTLNNISVMVNMRGVIGYTNTGFDVHQLGAYYNANFYSGIQYNGSSHVLSAWATPGYSSFAYSITIEYTKASDIAQG